MHSVKGILQDHNHKKLIHIDSSIKYKKALIAYIIGYFYLHHEQNHAVIFNNIDNQLSIKFASELLISDVEILKQQDLIEQNNIHQLAILFNQPLPIIQSKLNGLSDNQFIFYH